MNVQAALRNCPLFAGLDDAQIEQIAAIGRTRRAERGELLFADGDPADGFYVVLSGRVKVYKLSADGKERILHIVPPGQNFADAAIFGSGEFPACAEPTESSLLLFLPKAEFLDLLRSQPQMAINMIAGLSRFLRQFATQIEELTFKDVPARLARALLELCPRGSDRVTLAISKGQLASNLGTVSETLSRTFRKLSEEGVIAVQGKTITLLDPARLEELAAAQREG